MKTEILGKMFKLFLKNGFADISTNELIREAGLTKGGFYYMFKSRDELVNQVIEAYIHPYFKCPLARMEELWSCHDDAVTTEEMMWEGFFAPQRFSRYLEQVPFDVKFRDLYFLLYEGMKRYPVIETYFQDFKQKRSIYLYRILERGRQRGEIRQDIDIKNCVMMILAMQDGITAMRVLDDAICDEEKYRNVERQVLKDIGISDCNTFGGVQSNVS